MLRTLWVAALLIGAQAHASAVAAQVEAVGDWEFVQVVDTISGADTSFIRTGGGDTAFVLDIDGFGPELVIEEWDGDTRAAERNRELGGVRRTVHRYSGALSFSCDGSGALTSRLSLSYAPGPQPYELATHLKRPPLDPNARVRGDPGAWRGQGHELA